MKKTLLFAAFAALMINANAQTNLITKGDFKDMNTIAADGQVYRIAGFFDANTQINNPTIPATVPVTTGEWFKKAGAIAKLICQIKNDETLENGSLGNAARLTNGNEMRNQDQNNLTMMITLEQNAEYILSFDFKPVKKIEEYDGLLFVGVRNITNANKLGNGGISFNAVANDAFVQGENGWYKYSKKFNTNNFENTKGILYFGLNGENLEYDYMLSNVSIIEATTNSIATETADNIRVYASERSINIDGANGQVEIMDITGRLVKKTAINGSLNVPVSNEGIYLVSVTSEGKTKNTKVMVK